MQREVRELDYLPGCPLTDYTKDVIFDDLEIDYMIQANFVEYPNLTIPSDGDQLIIMPKIGNGTTKTILSVVATVALTYYAGLAGKAVGGGVWGGIVSAAITFVGGKLINHWFGTDSSSSATYTWDAVACTAVEGGVVGETYGECIPSPQVLEDHVETYNDEQYLDLLLCGGMGPVDSITDIKINGTLLSSFDSDYYSYETRLGTNDQTPISFFTDTPLDQDVSTELALNVPVTFTSDSTTATKLGVTLTWPNGFYYVKDNGSYDEAQMDITIEYAVSGTSNWIVFQSGQLSVNQSSTYRREFTVTPAAGAGKYDVRVTVTGQPQSSKNINTVDWSILTSYEEGTYSRPNKVLVGLRIRATNQLSSTTPTVTWRQKRTTVYVWNPDTLVYESKSARNPIWAAYDIYHQCRYLMNINTNLYEYTVSGVAHSRLDAYYDEWVAAAAYADEQVLGTDGTTYENRFVFDYFYDTEMTRYDAAQRAARCGRAVIMLRGNNIGIKVDMPGIMVQIFGQGRTTMSSLQGSFSGLADRARAIQVIYNETTNNYKNTPFLIRGTNWDSYEYIQDNPTTLTLYGVENKGQAYREGMYLLATNEEVNQTITIETDINAMSCEYGDIVGLAHNVPQIGTLSGRLIDGTSTTITLDDDVDLVAGNTYQIMVQHSVDDTLETKTIVAVIANTTTNLLTVSSPFIIAPAQYDNFAFGVIDKVVKPFRIINVERTGDLKVKLTLLEYIEAVYDGITDYPAVDYSPVTDNLHDPTALSLSEETYLATDGTVVTHIHATWTLTSGYRADTFYIYYSLDDASWIYWGSSETMATTITGLKAPQTYYVKVCTNLSGMTSAGLTEVIALTGKDTLPPDVESMQVVELSSGARRFLWQYDYPEWNDIAGFVIKANQGNTPFWANAIALHSGVLTSQPFETSALMTGTWSVMIKAVDTSGNYSDGIAYDIVNLGSEIVDHLIYTANYYSQGWTGTKTNCFVSGGYIMANSPGDLMFSTDSTSPMFTTANAAMFSAQYGAITYVDTFKAPQAGQMSISLDCDGSAQIWYRSLYPQPMFSGANQAMFSGSDDNMYTVGTWIAYTSKVSISSDTYQVMITISAGSLRPTIRTLTVNVDLPTVTESINSVAISASGTRLPITKTYTQILDINISIQSGSTAIGYQVIDYQTTIGAGPEIILLNSSGVAVVGTVSVTIQGV